MRRGDLRLVHVAGPEGTGRKLAVSSGVDVPSDGLSKRLSAGWQWMTEVLWPTRSRAVRRHVQLLEVVPLGARRELMLVSCDGERFLIGAGPDSVTSMMRVRPDAVPVKEKTTTPQGPVTPWG